MPLNVNFTLLSCFLYLGMVALSEGFLSSTLIASLSGSKDRVDGREMMKSMLSLIHGKLSSPLPPEKQQEIYTDIILACHEGTFAVKCFYHTPR